MNRIVRKLALDQIRFERKKTMLMILIIALISAAVFLVNIAYPPLKEMYRAWCLENFGSWYAYAEIPDDAYDLFRFALDGDDAKDGLKDLRPAEERTSEAKEEDLLHYGYLFEQGTWNDYTIAHADHSLYELCHLVITEGSEPQADEILISDEIQKRYGLNSGDTLKLTAGGIERELRICGIMHKPQDLFPDLYTGIEGGHALYFFDRMFSMYSSDHSICFSSYGLSMPFTENRYGYDHYTKTNDFYRYMKETTAFNDYALIRLISLSGAALFIYLVQTAGSRRRAKELSMLRAAGMTSPQVITMVMLETALTAFAGILCGLALSLLLLCICAFLIHTLIHADTSPLAQSVITHPLQPAGISLLILLFCLAGAYLPVLRSSQNALSGSFDQVYQGRRKKRRTKLRTLNMNTLALRQMEYNRGRWILMSVFAAFLCMIALPEKESEALDLSGSARQIIEIIPETMHYIELYEPVDEKICEDLELKSVQYLCANDESGTLHSEIRPDQTDQRYSLALYSGFVCIDENNISSLSYRGRLPENDHEIMLFDGMYSTYEIDDEGRYFSTNYSVQTGDTVYLNNEPYVICGFIEPEETVQQVIKDAGIDQIISRDFFSLPVSSAAVLNDTLGHLGLSTNVCKRLYFENHEDLYPLLNRMIQNGFRPERMSISDSAEFIDSYDSRFLSIHLSYGAAAVPFVIGLIVFALLMALDTQADSRELITLKCLGMSKKQLSVRQFLQALYTSLGALFLMAGYGLIRFVSGVSWHVSFLVYAIDLICALIAFTLIYNAVIPAADSLCFENNLED